MPATFTAHFDRIAPAANKYMVNIFNGASGRKVVIKRVWQYTGNVTAVTGVILEQVVRFIISRTPGTLVTPIAHDTSNTLNPSITADHNSTGVANDTSRGIYKRWFTTAEETLLTELSTSLEGAKTMLHDAQLVYWAKSDADGLVLRLNQGFVIQNITSSTVGTLSYIVEFTDEAA